jgi:hypothetical protein
MAGRIHRGELASGQIFHALREAAAPREPSADMLRMISIEAPFRRGYRRPVPFAGVPSRMKSSRARGVTQIRSRITPRPQCTADGKDRR